MNWKIIRTLILTVLISVAQGCVLPVPWPAEKPRFTEEQLSSLVPGTSTRDSIAKTLGPPSESRDFVRSEGRHWIYTWTRKGAGRVLAEGPPIAFSEKAFGLFLTFDESGVLASRQLIERATSAKTTRMCSSEGVCIAHFVLTPDLQDRRFHDPLSAFTVTQQRHSWKPPIGQCSVVIWLDGPIWTDVHVDWIRFHPALSTSPAWIPEPGVYIDVGPERAVTSWLPVDAYVVLTELPGERLVRFRNPWLDPNQSYLGLHPITQDVSFRCEAGRTYYVALGAASKELLKQFGVVWREIRVEEARERLQGMSELVLPDGVRDIESSLAVLATP